MLIVCSVTRTSNQYNPLYWVIRLFIVHFQLRFPSKAAAELLMQFINAILEFLSVSFRLAAKLATLRKHIGYGSATSTITRYAVCPTCHKTFNIDFL